MKHEPRREELNSINDDGSRYIIHPADVRGAFTKARKIVAGFLILLYAALPWIPVNGYPAGYLDTELMRFHFMGLTFASQDMWLAFFLISGLGFGLFYVTALAGRVWCGWACPQTVFLEHVYRRVERWIEGDAQARKRLDNAPIGMERILKRGRKHVAFLVVSLLLAHVFMAYFLSVPNLWAMMHQAPGENWGVFLFVFVYSVALYFNFGWFREQLCIIICPYGRLQSALIDENSLVIGYDEKRGEPRGKPKNEGVGDCVDCTRCVQVCPTGIDIRQGLQMECIGCSACIDACDSVMDKLNRPKGLIRYGSMNGLNGEKTKIVRPRIILYTVLLLIGALVLALSLRGVSETTITAWRVNGPPYFLEENRVRNQFFVRVTNKLNEPRSYRVSLEGMPEGTGTLGVDEPFTIDGNGDVLRTVVLFVPNDIYDGGFETELRILNEEGETVAFRNLNFAGPNPEMIK